MWQDHVILALLSIAAFAASEPRLLTVHEHLCSCINPGQVSRSLSVFVLAVTGIIFVVVFTLLVYSVIKFRGRAGDAGREPAQVYGSTQIELAWTIIPILIVVVLFLATARVIHAVQDAPQPPGAIEVTAIGHQYWWEFRYPKLGIVTANELHIPVSDPANPTPTFLTLLSADTDHSFWVPELAGKTDLIPNHPNRMWMDPQRTGIFLGQCAQYCGVQHAKMLLRVSVDSPEDFAAWVRGQQQPAVQDASVAAGRRVFESNCLHQLSHRRRNTRQRTLRPGPHAPDEPGHHRLRCSPKYTGKPAPLDSEPKRDQARLADAGHAVERGGPGCSRELYGDASLEEVEDQTCHRMRSLFPACRSTRSRGSTRSTSG